MLIKGYNRTMRKIEADMAEGGAPDEERIRRAQQDPEVRAILSDPVMQSVLKDMQTNPGAAQVCLFILFNSTPLTFILCESC